MSTPDPMQALRPGPGRPRKYPEGTQPVTFSLPPSTVTAIDELASAAEPGTSRSEIAATLIARGLAAMRLVGVACQAINDDGLAENKGLRRKLRRAVRAIEEA